TGDRVLPRSRNPVRASGFRVCTGGAGPRLAAPPHPRDPDLRRSPVDRRRPGARHRGLERVHLLGARRVRVRREAADMRWLIARGRQTWRALTSMGTALALLFLLALGAI